MLAMHVALSDDCHIRRWCTGCARRVATSTSSSSFRTRYYTVEPGFDSFNARLCSQVADLEPAVACLLSLPPARGDAAAEAAEAAAVGGSGSGGGTSSDGDEYWETRYVLLLWLAS
jgi:hypothetical protein